MIGIFAFKFSIYTVHVVVLHYTFYSDYEQYLDAKFPFGSYKQVFLAPEMAISSSTFGASLSILSSQVLFDEKVIDQVCLLLELILLMAHLFIDMEPCLHIT